MKIAIVTPVYPPYKGGMGAVAATDAKHLRARGAEVFVFTPDYGRGEKHPEATYLPAMFAIGNAALLPSLLKHLHCADVAHLHYTFYGADIFVGLWSLFTRRPYVLTYHMRPQTNDYRDVLFRIHRALVEPLVIRGARSVLVSSRDYAESLGLRHANLVELPFGVDATRFTPGRDEVTRERLGIPPEATTFLFVGGLDKAHSFKGVDVLLRAAALLPQARAWRVLIVGEGELRPEYMQLAKKLGVSDRVIFAGSVSPEELPGMYRAADAHVLPSVSQSEAFGLVTLEAAATGIPSIVSNLPGVRTVVVPEETGLVVPPGDERTLAQALQRFLNDPGLAKNMGVKARERALAMYHPETLADRLFEVYKR